MSNLLGLDDGVLAVGRVHGGILLPCILLDIRGQQGSNKNLDENRILISNYHLYNVSDYM